MQNWAKQNNVQAGGAIPTETDNVHIPAYAPKISIISPLAVQTYGKNDRITITLQYASQFPIAKVDYFLNDLYLGTGSSAPWNFSFVASQVDGTQLDNQLKAVATDLFGNKGETTTKLTINQ